MPSGPVGPPDIGDFWAALKYEVLFVLIFLELDVSITTFLEVLFPLLKTIDPLRFGVYLTL